MENHAKNEIVTLLQKLQNNEISLEISQIEIFKIIDNDVSSKKEIIKPIIGVASISDIDVCKLCKWNQGCSSEVRQKCVSELNSDQYYI